MLYVDPIAERHIAAPGGPGALRARREGAAQEFERFFVYQLVREMRKGVPKTGLLGKSQQQDLYEEMFDDFLSGEMARSGQLGIAKLVCQELEKAGAAPALTKSTATQGIARHPERSFPLRANPSAEFPLEREPQAGIPVKKANSGGIPISRRMETGRQ